MRQSAFDDIRLHHVRQKGCVSLWQKPLRRTASKGVRAALAGETLVSKKQVAQGAPSILAGRPTWYSQRWW